MAGLPALKPRLTRKQANAENTEKVKAHQDDDETANLGENIEVLAQQRADRRSTGTQRHEDRGKTEREEESRKQHGPGGFLAAARYSPS